MPELKCPGLEGSTLFTHATLSNMLDNSGGRTMNYVNMWMYVHCCHSEKDDEERECVIRNVGILFQQEKHL